jgi:dTDP-4-amino-4,6-dideoxygalactose transaminase
MPGVPAAVPTRLSPEERDAVHSAVLRVIDEGPWIGGPEVEAFEAELGAYLGAGAVVGCASGTDALVLALTALDVPAGSEVLVPAHDGGYAATAVRLAGSVPVPVDVDAGTSAPGVGELEAALSGAPGARALIVTHLHGDPLPLEPIDAWRRAHGLILIEDCAQAAGARVDGRAAGTIGDAGAFSFYPTKNLGAAGDAGAVAFADPAAAERARSLARYGWGERFRVLLPRGRNSRLDPLQAAILRARLPYLDARNAARAAIRSRYLAAVPDLRFLGTPDTVAHHAVVRTRDRDRLAAHLSSRGVATEIHYPVVVGDMPGLELSADRMPQSRRLCGEVLSLPCAPELRDDEVEAVCAALTGWGAS